MSRTAAHRATAVCPLEARIGPLQWSEGIRPADDFDTDPSVDDAWEGQSMSHDGRENRHPNRRRRRRRRDRETGRLVDPIEPTRAMPPPPPAPAPAPPPASPVPPVPAAAPRPPRPPRADEDARLSEIDEATLSAEERRYLEARRLAEEKVGFYRDAVRLALIVVPLLIFIPVAGAIVLFVGGIKLGRTFYRVMVEPGLRQRLVEQEVDRHVQVSLHEERQVLEGEHSRSLEELSASIAHEIRNPITAAKSLVQQMEEDPTAHDNVEYARVALGELERVEKSISHLLKYARDEDVRMEACRMADVLDSALETFRDRVARTGVEIVRQFDSTGAMVGDPEKLRRIFINLVGNAIDAMEQARIDKPRIEVALGENLAGTEIWVRIRDNGPGIDEEIAQKIFNPFFTSKQGGTGLGLPITKKLVDAHHGSIELETEPAHGTQFTLTFPKSGGSRGEVS